MASFVIWISSTSCLIRTNEVLSFLSIALIFSVVSFSSFFIGFILGNKLCLCFWFLVFSCWLLVGVGFKFCCDGVLG